MFSAVVLAAGTSSRMGASNKLLLPWQGKPVVAHVADALQESQAREIVVVLGHEKEKVRTALQDRNLRFVVNKNYASGLTSSIQAGVMACAGHSRGYLICLADMPFIRTADYNYLLSAVSGQKEIIVPAYKGQKGNPVFFSAHFKNAILQHNSPTGCRDLVAQNKALVKLLEMDSQVIRQDIDTPEDYDNLSG